MLRQSLFSLRNVDFSGFFGTFGENGLVFYGEIRCELKILLQVG